jgi:uncharacterized damage-inducible protein DinB
MYSLDMQDYVLKAFSKTPHIVERVLRVFPHDRLDDVIEKDRFTAREVIAHLADYEQTVLERFRTAKLKPGTQVDNYDPDERAASHKFSEKEPFREAEVFESRRGITVTYLSEFTEEDWKSTFVHPSGKTMTARDYLNMLVGHDLDHIDQLSAYLATEVATIS